jgi:protein-S-isoprenylcysteine O-methyltransferase Ste14
MKIAIGLWCAFSIYWSIASKDQAATESSESVWSRQLHLVIVNAALLLLIFPVPHLTQRFLPDSVVASTIGLLITAASVLLAVWARIHLGSNWSGEVRIAKDHQLVNTGPYRVVRHPIYTALLGMYAGTAIVSGELHAIVATVAIVLAYWRKIRLEERALSTAFGANHARYRESTWAWIPGVY